MTFNKYQRNKMGDVGRDLSFERIFSLSDVQRLIAQFMDVPFGEIQRSVYLIKKDIERFKSIYGLQWCCQQLKRVERHLMLEGEFLHTSFTSLKKIFFFPNGERRLSEKCFYTLLSIHRNMKVRPVPSFKTISKSIKTETISKITDSDDEIRKILSHPFFHIKEYGRVFSKGDTRLKTIMDRKKDNPYTCDPTIDTNGRTGGHECPIQVSWKKRLHGTCFDSHSKDYAVFKTKYPHLLGPLKRVWKEWNYNLKNTSFQSIRLSPCEMISGKIVPLQDKSCKTREVAIFDSLSQIALRPVHQMLEDVLKQIPTDFTFDHLKGVQYLQKIGKNKECFSVDIKSATDTIPAILSEKIFRILLNPKIVDNPDIFCKDIFQILTNRKFSFEKRNLKYGVGQPMGAYASFPFLALTNHVMVHLAALRAGIYSNMTKNYFFSEYAIVGDDVVICNSKVAREYYKVLESFDIPISTQKCVSGVGTFEFCHRIVRNGILQSVPSWNAYAMSHISRDPTPLMTIYRNYGLDLRYGLLRAWFKPKHVRTACAFQEFIFSDIQGGTLSVEIIPSNVIGHAVRSLEIAEIRSRIICEPLSTDDKFLNRLNYCINIQKMFNSSKFGVKFKLKEVVFTRFFKKTFNNKAFKKALEPKSRDESRFLVDVTKGSFNRRNSRAVAVWDIAHKVIANTFYLNYLFNYRNQKKFYRRSFTLRGETGSSIRLRSYCMSQKLKWLDDRLLNPIKQDRVIQTKAYFPSGKRT
jgi:hypothetical protein